MTPSETELALDLGADTIRCTPEEVASALAGALREMRIAAPFVTPEEREALRLIMSRESAALTVGDVFPDFDRDTDALTALRRLRTAQFIRPAGHDRWEVGERIAVKPLARLLWDRVGEGAIFGDAPEAPAAEDEFVVERPDEEPEGSEDIDLSLPGVNETDEVETVRMADRTATAWDEADVLSFLNDEGSPDVVKPRRS